VGALTHASFFSGVGGLDLGLERAGWRTVSFSEIDPYASAVLAERWPGVPNLGDIVTLVGHERTE
jgi:DNA (cytosine-5)-methyltransferase 1